MVMRVLTELGHRLVCRSINYSYKCERLGRREVREKGKGEGCESDKHGMKHSGNIVRSL